MSEPVYRPVILLAKSLRKVMGWKVIIKGAGNLPSTGPAILAINHAGYLDFVFSAWACVFERKRWVRFLAKKEVFDHKIAGVLMRSMKHIPVDRENDPARALDLAIDALQAGEVVGTFPEATIDRSFVPGRGKTGTVRMAQASGASVVPVAVWGAHRILTKGHPRNFQRGVAILVSIGRPLSFDPEQDPREATNRLMDAIRGLLAEAQAQYPQAPADARDRWWLPAHLGGTAPAPSDPPASGTARSPAEQPDPATQAATAKPAPAPVEPAPPEQAGP